MLSIAVAPDFRQCGVGRLLIEALEVFLREHHCTTYKVVTHAADPASNAFYTRAGFSLHRSFQHHGRTMHEYVKGITDSERSGCH